MGCWSLTERHRSCTPEIGVRLPGGPLVCFVRKGAGYGSPGRFAKACAFAGMRVRLPPLPQFPRGVMEARGFPKAVDRVRLPTRALGDAIPRIVCLRGSWLGCAETDRYNTDMDSFDVSAEAPKVYRAMKHDPADNLPVVGSTGSAELGVRLGYDITVDAAGNVVLDSSGMSVAPRWRDLNFTRIPRRLRHIVPGATGSNSTSCFGMGSGPFQSGFVAKGLELIPDKGPSPVTHGVIAPAHSVPLADYQADLGNTRADWQIDES